METIFSDFHILTKANFTFSALLIPHTEEVSGCIVSFPSVTATVALMVSKKAFHR